MTHDEIRAAIASMDDAELEECGLVRGPVDACGVMWHEGDMSDTNWGAIGGVAFRNGRWYVCGHGIDASWIEADSVRHAHETTVEEILDGLEGLKDAGGHETVATALVAEFARMLRKALRDHEPTTSEVRSMTDSMGDDELAECGLMRLPTDDNGDPIRIGDEMWLPNGECRVVNAIGDNSVLFLDEYREILTSTTEEEGHGGDGA